MTKKYYETIIQQTNIFIFENYILSDFQDFFNNKEYSIQRNIQIFIIRKNFQMKT